VLAPGPVQEDGNGLWLSGRIFQALERRVAGLDGLSIAFPVIGRRAATGRRHRPPPCAPDRSVGDRPAGR